MARRRRAAMDRRARYGRSVRDSTLRPTFGVDLLAMRRESRRPLGGIVLVDCWRAVEAARRADLFPVYLRVRDDWTRYDLSAVSGLDVLLHLVEHDPSRIETLIEHVKGFSPRSLRVSTQYQNELISGKEHALAELLRWWTTRCRIATAPIREAA